MAGNPAPKTSRFRNYTPHKPTAGISKMMGLGKGGSLKIYGNIWYLCLISGGYTVFCPDIWRQNFRSFMGDSTVEAPFGRYNHVAAWVTWQRGHVNCFFGVLVHICTYIWFLWIFYTLYQYFLQYPFCETIANIGASNHILLLVCVVPEF